MSTWEWLRNRGIAAGIIQQYQISVSPYGKTIIPVSDPHGKFLFNKYRRSPDVSSGPKYTYDKGASAALYGAHLIPKGTQEIWLVEGELDVLRAVSAGLPAVSSTGGAGTFTPEMAAFLKRFDTVNVCYDNDNAGKTGAERVVDMLGRANVVTLPEWVGEHGDLTDYLNGIRLSPSRPRWTRHEARRRPPPKPNPFAVRDPVEKSGVDFASVLEARGVKVQQRKRFVTVCPFHDDRSPSFSVDVEKMLYKCHGCSAAGDVISFVMKADSVGFKEALEILGIQRK